MTLIFSDFAQLLYNFCGYDETKPQFVITLTDNIMIKPGANKSEGYQNPMKNKNVRTLQYYFSGKRPIAPKDARVILADLRKSKFEKFIYKYSDDDLKILSDKLSEKGVSSVTILNIGEKCADIFESILMTGKYEEAEEEN